MEKETACLHSGAAKDPAGGLVTPIQPSTAYEYLDAEEQLYPRYFNTPNQQAVLRKLCALEAAEAGILFGSGMAAISTVLLALLGRGDHAVFLDGLYGGTHGFVTHAFEGLGVDYAFAPNEVDALEAAVTDRTKVIYVESPTNPLLSIVDLQGVAEVGRRRGVTTVIDNTFASPIHQTPIRLGLDVVVHSGTKYLGGHSDLSCGAVLTTAVLAERIRAKAVHLGGTVNALTCYLLERSLKTLSVRVERQTQNAAAIAAFLEGHPAVNRVYYPGLSTHPGHAVAARQMDGFGAMLSFELSDTAGQEAFLRRLELITPALSLGGVESTICAPAATSHRALPPDERRRLGISDALLRFSAGIEHVGDLIADLQQALTGAARHPSASRHEAA